MKTSDWFWVPYDGREVPYGDFRYLVVNVGNETVGLFLDKYVATMFLQSTLKFYGRIMDISDRENPIKE